MLLKLLCVRIAHCLLPFPRHFFAFISVRHILNQNEGDDEGTKKMMRICKKRNATEDVFKVEYMIMRRCSRMMMLVRFVRAGWPSFTHLLLTERGGEGEGRG